MVKREQVKQNYKSELKLDHESSGFGGFSKLI